MLLHFAHTAAAPRPVHWYRHPDGTLHAFRGFRSLCDRWTWQASWAVVDETAMPSEVRCPDCLAALAGEKAR